MAFIIIEAIGVVCLVLGFVLGIAIIGILFALSFILGGLYVWSKGKKCISRSYCPHCEKKYNYDTDISWEITDTTETINKITANVEFECICSKCENQQTFTQKFVTSYYDQKQDAWKENNIHTMARKYFWK